MLIDLNSHEVQWYLEGGLQVLRSLQECMPWELQKCGL